MKSVTASAVDQCTPVVIVTISCTCKQFAHRTCVICTEILSSVYNLSNFVSIVQTMVSSVLVRDFGYDKKHSAANEDVLPYTD